MQNFWAHSWSSVIVIVSGFQIVLAEIDHLIDLCLVTIDLDCCPISDKSLIQIFWLKSFLFHVQTIIFSTSLNITLYFSEGKMASQLHIFCWSCWFSESVFACCFDRIILTWFSARVASEYFHFIVQGGVVRKPVNVNPRFNVNWSIFSSSKMFFTSNVWCSLGLLQLKTEGQTI